MSKLLQLANVEALYYLNGHWLESLSSLTNYQQLKVVVLLHGYGANAWDLASIAEYHHQQRQFHKNNQDQSYLWIFPQGVLSLSGGNQNFDQRAWFPISVERLMLQRTSGPDFLSQQKIESGDELLAALQEYFIKLHSLGLNNLCLGGFSQGGMIAYQLLPMILDYFKLELLALFSTVSIDFNRYHPLWQKHVSYQALPRLIQSHGKVDQVLSYQEGKNLFSYLSPYFQNSEFLDFNDGHTIAPNVISRFFNLI